MKNYVNLHQHTTYSMLDGHGTCENYAKRAKELQMGYSATTDHGNICSWVEHNQACKDNGLKPIFGIEAYQARKHHTDRDEEERAGPAKDEWAQRGPYHLTILAKNATGYQNLIKLSSTAFLEGYYVKPRISHEMIERYSDGLIVLSGCLNGEVQQALLRGDADAALRAAVLMQEIVGKENYFIEVHNHGIEEQLLVMDALILIAKMIGAPIVPTQDCHYVHKEDHDSHDLMLCSGTGARIDTEGRFKFSGPEFYLKSYEEMLERFEPEWLDNTCKIAEMIDVQMEFASFNFPKYPDVPPEKTVTEYLRELVMDGLTFRYGTPSQEAIDRANSELGIIQRMGFEEYFLVVGDIVGWARNNGIRVGPGRGSAAGSLVSYALRITNLDPIKLGLMFDRFLIEGRNSPPDIDLDFDDRYRDLIIEYIRKKYGEDRVAHIVTFSEVKAKQAIRDAARVLNFDYLTGDRVSKMVPDPVLGVTKTLKESLQSEDMYKAYTTDPDVKTIVDAAMGLEGIYRQMGIHAAGIVIAPGPITDYIPVMVAGPKKDLVVTAWDMKAVEKMGLLKVDILGLRNLAVIDMAIDNIKKFHGEDIDVDNNFDLEDEAVYQSLCEGSATGIFQLEGSGMKEMMVKLQPSSLLDIMALVSLYRPGPLGSGMDRMYIDRKHGRERATVPHEKLKDVLKDSYGIFLYQEDILNICYVLAGMDATEADDLRRVIGKKEMEKVGEYREKFVAGCVNTSQVTEATANKIYSDIEYFAGYGFGRGHAASYALVSYTTAWLKHHYPAAYMAALLTSVATKKDKLAVYLHESKRLNLKVLPPSLAYSESEFAVKSEDEILFGLSGIDGMGPSKIATFLQGRNPDKPYTSLFDFFSRADKSVVAKGSLDKFMAAGALDDLVDKRSAIDPDDKREILDAERDVLGIYVTDHPLSGIAAYLKTLTNTEVLDLLDHAPGSEVKIGGMISSVIKKTTKKGNKMYNLQFEDLSGMIEVVVFPYIAEKLDNDFLEQGLIGVLTADLKIEGEGENLMASLVYKRFERVDESVYGQTPPIILDLPDNVSGKQMKRIHDIIESNKGESIVYFRAKEGNHEVTFRFLQGVDPAMEKQLQETATVIKLHNEKDY